MAEPSSSPASVEARAAALEAARLLADHKGEDTVVLDIGAVCSFADYFIITTARSSAHLAGLHGAAATLDAVPSEILPALWPALEVMPYAERFALIPSATRAYKRDGPVGLVSTVLGRVARRSVDLSASSLDMTRPFAPR